MHRGHVYPIGAGKRGGCLSTRDAAAAKRFLGELARAAQYQRDVY